ncbi:hypothetical protein D3C84_876190 [compost metagenome]
MDRVVLGQPHHVAVALHPLPPDRAAHRNRRLGLDQLDVESLPVAIAEADVDGGLVRAQRIGPDVGEQAHLDVGIGRHELTQPWRQPEHGEGRGRTHGDRTISPAAEQPDGRHGQLVEGLADRRQVGQPHVRQAHATRQALEQLEPQVML